SNVVTIIGTTVLTSMAVGGGLWMLAIRPLENEVAAAKAERMKISERLEAVEHGAVQTVEKLGEVETQFRMSSHIANLRHGEDFRMVQLLWQEVFRAPLPERDYNPEISKH